MAEPIDVSGVIATVIADLRASGNTGMVENLLDADAAIKELIEKASDASSLMRSLIDALGDTEFVDGDSQVVDELDTAIARVSGGAK